MSKTGPETDEATPLRDGPAGRHHWISLPSLAALSIPAILFFCAYGLQEHALQRRQRELDQATTRDSQVQRSLAWDQKRQSHLSELRARLARLEMFRASHLDSLRGLDAIGNSIHTRSLWLTHLKTDGKSMQMEGRAGRLLEVSGFVADLKALGAFGRVELISWVRTKDSVSFSVKAVSHSGGGLSE